MPDEPGGEDYLLRSLVTLVLFQRGIEVRGIDLKHPARRAGCGASKPGSRKFEEKSTTVCLLRLIMVLVSAGAR